MPTLKQKFSNAARGLRASPSPEVDPTRTERTEVSESGNGIGDEDIGPENALGITVDEEYPAQVVERHSWENVPEEEKGEGKFYRKASPGGWSEDLTPEQAETVARITASLLKEFYSYEGQSEDSSERLPLDWFSRHRVFYA